MAADQGEEPGERPVDPLLGQPRMVDDPRISVAQAAVVLGKKPAQVHRFIALGRLPRHGPPNNGRPLLLSEVEALRDKGEPIPLKDAAHMLGRSLKATLELVADGHLLLVPGTKSMVYPADVAAIASAKPQPPIRRAAGPPGYLNTKQTAERLGLSAIYVTQLAAAAASRYAACSDRPAPPRGAVTTFCAEHGISRKTFYEIRRRSLTDGPAAVLEPRSRRPKSSPSNLADEVKRQATGLRAALEQSGLDCGPVSAHDKMRSLGLEPVPSTASLARIFREAGVARPEPRKKPRAAWRRFVYPAPNACWQLDATEYVLTRWAQVRDLPAHRRPLPLRGRLPRRVGRDRRGGDRRLRQGRWPLTGFRNGCCPTTGPRSTRRGADSWASSSST